MKQLNALRWVAVGVVSVGLGLAVFWSMLSISPVTAHQDGAACTVRYCRTMNLNAVGFNTDADRIGGWWWMRGPRPKRASWSFQVPPDFPVDPRSNQGKPYLIINFRVPVHATHSELPSGVNTETWDGQCKLIVSLGAGQQGFPINLIDMGSKVKPEDHRGVTSVKVYTGKFTAGPITVTLIRRGGGPPAPAPPSEPHVGVNQSACWLTYIFTHTTTRVEVPTPVGEGGVVREKEIEPPLPPTP